MKKKDINIGKKYSEEKTKKSKWNAEEDIQIEDDFKVIKPGTPEILKPKPDKPEETKKEIK